VSERAKDDPPGFISTIPTKQRSLVEPPPVKNRSLCADSTPICLECSFDSSFSTKLFDLATKFLDPAQVFSFSHVSTVPGEEEHPAEPPYEPGSQSVTKGWEGISSARPAFVPSILASGFRIP
jgi:hypothetical protein